MNPVLITWINGVVLVAAGVIYLVAATRALPPNGMRRGVRRGFQIRGITSVTLGLAVFSEFLPGPHRPLFASMQFNISWAVLVVGFFLIHDLEVARCNGQLEWGDTS